MILDAQPGGASSWAEFLQAHAEQFRRSGLPRAALESQERWVDFLSHGYLDEHEDPDDFAVEELNEEQYAILEQLVVAYFRAGFEFVVPIALRTDDYLRLTGDFAGLQDRRNDPQD